MKKALIILATLTVLSFAWAILLMIKFYIAINEPKQEYKEGSIVVLGESGSMRLATPEDVDNDTLGMIVESFFYKDIKLEVGQVWYLPNYGINVKILELNPDYVEIFNIEYNLKSKYHIDLFTMYDMELKETPNGYFTVRGLVKGINTKDINYE